MESQSNRSYFNSEANKNRDTWKHSDGDRVLRVKNVRANPFLSGKFDDVIKYQQPEWIWKKAEGDEAEYENEDSVEAENEEAMVEEEFTEEELPKFRQLVRAKKLEYKAQYGKAHFSTRRECKNVPYPGTCYKKVAGVDVPYPCTKYKEVCINIPTWVWGWRKKWREFKQQGGLAQLKMISRGMAPLVPPTGTTNTPPANTGGGGRNANKAGEIVDVGSPKLDVGDGTSQAGLAGNIIGTILVLGLVFGAIKMMK